MSPRPRPRDVEERPTAGPHERTSRRERPSRRRGAGAEEAALREASDIGSPSRRGTPGMLELSSETVDAEVDVDRLHDALAVLLVNAYRRRLAARDEPA